ncbi:unnamed protein product [Caenorhabditis auriculariae]|uniref:Uncharacterized protein n=1 Tax=Caenorhabditis auriculariae TaxID=2777116 RepID=A0A8S1GZ75_9PELO|nr:unnamed protein product [Caenorhabditis auriculariae]
MQRLERDKVEKRPREGRELDRVAATQDTGGAAPSPNNIQCERWSATCPLDGGSRQSEVTGARPPPRSQCPSPPADPQYRAITTRRLEMGIFL